MDEGTNKAIPLRRSRTRALTVSSRTWTDGIRAGGGRMLAVPVERHALADSRRSLGSTSDDLAAEDADAGAAAGVVVDPFGGRNLVGRDALEADAFEELLGALGDGAGEDVVQGAL